MANQDQMPKVDFVKDKELLKNSAVDYIKQINKKNLVRAEKFVRTRRNNLLTGAILGAGVFSIYLYSILAVKQEKFLDDFEEPLKTTN